MTTAAKYLASKQVVGTTLSSREIEDYVPAALTNNAAFSARTIYTEHITETQRDITSALQGKDLNPAQIRTRMKMRLAKLGYQPELGAEGSITDLSSDLRTNLIINHNRDNARGYAVWRSQQNKAILKVWPAQELYRASDRLNKRKWKQRWNEARRALGEGNTSATYASSDSGPFVANKNDPIWVHPSVNRFGNSWTPFDFNSGMGLRQVMAKTARELGVLTDHNAPAVRRDPMSTIQSASAAGVPRDILNQWIKPFGARARLHDGRVYLAPASTNVDAVLDAAVAGQAATAAVNFAPSAVIKAAAKLVNKSLPPVTTITLDSADAERMLKAVSRDDIAAAAGNLKGTLSKHSDNQIQLETADNRRYLFDLSLNKEIPALLLKSIEMPK